MTKKVDMLIYIISQDKSIAHLPNHKKRNSYYSAYLNLPFLKPVPK